MRRLDALAFAEFLIDRAEAKDGYIMGSIGQNPKKWSKTSWYFMQYKGAQRRKALEWRAEAERVWDCQGLAEGYINDMLGTTINVYARTNYANWCNPKGNGRIPVQHRLPGAAVFYHNGSRITHVGYLVEPVVSGKPEGDWWVVEARGVMYGVVKTKLYSRNWNRWGLMTKYFAYESANVERYELGDRILRRGCIGEDVRELQSILITLGYSCGIWGADGEFGRDTEAALIRFQEYSDGVLAIDGDMDQDDLDELREAFNGTPDEPDEPDENMPDAPQAPEPEEPEPEPEPTEPIDYEKKKFLDLSEWNGKIADGEKCARDSVCAIHRASIETRKDKVFAHNVGILKRAGIPFGAYHYLKALTVADAEAEAEAFYVAAAQFMPKTWAIDCECGAITKRLKKDAAFARTITDAFRDKLISLGVPADRIGVYIGHHLYKSWRLDYSKYAFVWIPRYGKNIAKILKEYFPAYPCDLHQYTSRGKCAGIADKTLDLNRVTGKGKTLAWFRGEK